MKLSSALLLLLSALLSNVEGKKKSLCNDAVVNRKCDLSHIKPEYVTDTVQSREKVLVRGCEKFLPALA